MAFKRSAVRSRLSPPENWRFALESSETVMVSDDFVVSVGLDNWEKLCAMTSRLLTGILLLDGIGYPAEVLVIDILVVAEHGFGGVAD